LWGNSVKKKYGRMVWCAMSGDNGRCVNKRKPKGFWKG